MKKTLHMEYNQNRYEQSENSSLAVSGADSQRLPEPGERPGR
jgi:hypothetical protein